MIDKEKYPELYKITEDVIDKYRRWYREALQCQVLCASLPSEIKALPIIEADLLCGKLTLTIRNEENTIATLKTLGIQGLKPQVSHFSDTSFTSLGEGLLPDGTGLLIHVTNLDQPEGCYVKTEIVTRKEYSLVCEKSGEQI